MSTLSPSLNTENYFFVNAFSIPKHSHSGNPAVVIILQKWINKEELQEKATEFNQPAAAFLVPLLNEISSNSSVNYEIRWFTPTNELPLCGHGSLAASKVLFQLIHPTANKINFHYGLYSNNEPKKLLLVTKCEKTGLIELELGIEKPIEISSAEEHTELTQSYYKILRKDNNKTKQAEELKQETDPQFEILSILNCRNNTTHFVVLDSPDAIKAMKPDLSLFTSLFPNKHAFYITAKGFVSTPKDNSLRIEEDNWIQSTDFVSRVFMPNLGVAEDYVCGSAHSCLVEYWGNKLNKEDLLTYQCSPRGGKLLTKLNNQEKKIKLKADAQIIVAGRLL